MLTSVQEEIRTSALRRQIQLNCDNLLSFSSAPAADSSSAKAILSSYANVYASDKATPQLIVVGISVLNIPSS